MRMPTIVVRMIVGGSNPLANAVLQNVNEMDPRAKAMK